MRTQSWKMAAGLFAPVLIAAIATSANSQLQGCSLKRNQPQSTWRLYSPPDKSFTVELPREPRRTDKIDPTSADEASFFECTESVEAYELKLKPQSPEYAFVIGVFDVSGCRRKAEIFNQEVNGLVAVIGGDNKHLIKIEQVKINGLPGRVHLPERPSFRGVIAFLGWFTMRWTLLPKCRNDY